MTSTGDLAKDAATALVQVAVIEDHPLYRQALETVIMAFTSTSLALSTATIEEFDARAAHPPDVVLVDLHLPGLDGGPGVRHLAGKGLNVLVLSASTDAPAVIEAIGAGARGYLSKDAQAAEILAAVQAVAAGRGYVSPALTGHLLQPSRREAQQLPELSHREQEVLAHLAIGETDHEIARTLCISVSTVRSHLDRIRDKTGKRRRADLTRFALEHSIDV